MFRVLSANLTVDKDTVENAVNLSQIERITASTVGVAC